MNRPKYVFWFMIDGCRGDGFHSLRTIDTPNIDDLIEENTIYSFKGLSDYPSSTMHNVPGMLTGNYTETHEYSNTSGTEVESIMRVFLDNDITTGGVDGKDGDRLTGFDNQDEWTYFRTVETDRPTNRQDQISVDELWDIFNTNETNFNYVLMADTDYSGHDHGHTSDEYRGAIENADEIIGDFIDKLKANGYYEDSLIVINSDHGMTGTSHGSDSLGDMRIPVIIHCPLAQNIHFDKIMKERSRFGNVFYPEQMDITTTICRIMGLRDNDDHEGILLPAGENQELREEMDVTEVVRRRYRKSYMFV